MNSEPSTKFQAPLRDRLLRKVEPVPFSGCWLWMGALLKGRGNHRPGYGIINPGGGNKNSMLAHRASWQVHKGQIPDGIHVLHRCDIPCCVNPDHLFLGTRSDNMKDAANKGRLGKQTWKKGDMTGGKNSGSKLTELHVKAMRELRAQGWQYEDLRLVFGVTYKSVYCICKGRNWKEVSCD